MPVGLSYTRYPVRFAIRIALLSFVAYAAWTLVRGYWQQDEMHRKVAEAYEFVIQHGEVTSYLPCFCGCGKRESHSSLDSCFVTRRDKSGRMVSRDPHAETCKVCIDVAVDAKQMLRDGRTLTEIRSAVESKYAAEYPFRTNTPKVP